MLWRVGDLIDEHLGEIAELETRDQGKPIGVSQMVIGGVAEHFRYYAGWVTKIEGETPPVSIPGVFHYTLRQPIGVCALIIPWNFPTNIASWKIAPALACGNTAVVKPAEQAPLTTLRLAELIQEAGIPDGVLNVVTGGPAVGQALAEPRWRRQDLLHRLDRGRARDRPRCGRQPETGESRARRQGPNRDPRRCRPRRRRRRQPARERSSTPARSASPTSRFFVDAARADEFAEKAAAAVDAMKIGPGIDRATELGPLVTEEHLDRVHGFVEAGQREGAKLVTGGGRAEGDLEGGHFYRPTVFSGRHGRDDDRPRGDLRPGDLDPSLRLRGRARRSRQRHRVRARGLGLDSRRGPCPPSGRGDQGRDDLDQHAEPGRRQSLRGEDSNPAAGAARWARTRSSSTPRRRASGPRCSSRASAVRRVMRGGLAGG